MAQSERKHHPGASFQKICLRTQRSPAMQKRPRMRPIKLQQTSHYQKSKKPQPPTPNREPDAERCSPHIHCYVRLSHGQHALCRNCASQERLDWGWVELGLRPIWLKSREFGLKLCEPWTKVLVYPVIVAPQNLIYSPIGPPQPNLRVERVRRR